MNKNVNKMCFILIKTVSNKKEFTVYIYIFESFVIDGTALWLTCKVVWKSMGKEDREVGGWIGKKKDGSCSRVTRFLDDL